ncbi:helix-turn-helix transcriptional regulator [bacterium]|nr:helix-turn-helix transcriptional regulator [bacterium]
MKKFEYNYVSNTYPFLINVADNLLYLRNKKGYTQSQLANLCGVSKNTISSIERKEHLPSLTLIVSLCLVLDCNFNQLCEITDSCATIFIQL